MNTTSRFPMTRLVISFNRHFFIVALSAVVVAAVLLFLIDNAVVRWVLVLGIAAAIYFIISSVLASYFIYDRSDLYKLQEWPDKCLPDAPHSAVIIHAGFDPSSGAFCARFPRAAVRVLDFFKPEETTELSIQIAHRLNPPSGTQEYTPTDAWPVETASVDAVMAISAAHEIRDDERRAAFFREARRVLKPGGRVVVVEQLRSLPNFLCFGVAAFHFLSRRTWLRSFHAAGLNLQSEFAVTPFVRAFVLT